MYITVCKNVIAQNNKKDWVDPEPVIRVSKTPAGKVVMRSNRIGIVDSTGALVAELIATEDGKPIISCGAKVALITQHDVIDL